VINDVAEMPYTPLSSCTTVTSAHAPTQSPLACRNCYNHKRHISHDGMHGHQSGHGSRLSPLSPIVGVRMQPEARKQVSSVAIASLCAHCFVYHSLSYTLSLSRACVCATDSMPQSYHCAFSSWLAHPHWPAILVTGLTTQGEMGQAYTAFIHGF
jgi:hypothetical protein